MEPNDLLLYCPEAPTRKVLKQIYWDEEEVNESTLPQLTIPQATLSTLLQAIGAPYRVPAFSITQPLYLKDLKSRISALQAAASLKYLKHYPQSNKRHELVGEVKFEAPNGVLRSPTFLLSYQEVENLSTQLNSLLDAILAHTGPTQYTLRCADLIEPPEVLPQSHQEATP